MNHARGPGQQFVPNTKSYKYLSIVRNSYYVINTYNNEYITQLLLIEDTGFNPFVPHRIRSHLHIYPMIDSGFHSFDIFYDSCVHKMINTVEELILLPSLSGYDSKEPWYH